MIDFIKRFVVWLRRVRYSRGFGVHSPWAYRFIRYVVNEHYPYYKYEHLAEQVYGIDEITRKLCKFYFRLANYQQAHTFVDCFPTSSCYKIYVDAGCQKVNYHRITDAISEDELIRLFSNIGEYSMVRVPLVANYRMVVDKALDHLPSSSVLIIENIKRDRDAQRYWSELISDSRTGVSFDLYYCGVLFLNNDMVKQSYIVNF
ncbi:MAG: hypothetical protein ACFN1E_08560 [Prevotella melaninogenica]